MSQVSVPADQVLACIKRLLEFPFPQICRHLAACDLLDLLERNGFVLPPGLALAVVRGSNGDAEALSIVEKIRSEAY